MGYGGPTYKAPMAEKNGATRVTGFLNRLLAMPVRDQMLLFQYFQDIMEALLNEARINGKLNTGIVRIKQMPARPF